MYFDSGTVTVDSAVVVNFSVAFCVVFAAVVVVAVVTAASVVLGTVVAGLVDVPVIAVPTSVGYGIGADGKAALYSMLQSCAPGLSVVNIDNGFGAGVCALTIAKNIAKRVKMSKE